MNELQTTTAQLPDTIEDLSRFVLVGREKLTAVRAEIRAIEKVGLAREVHQQKLMEAQEIAEAVLDAEMRIGELTARITKSQGKRTDIEPIRNGAEKSKKEQLAQIGIKQDTAERYEALARHPEIVEQAKAKAREKGEIVTRQSALDEIHATVCGKNKSPAQMKREFLDKTRQEHEDFQEKKTEGVVSMQEVQRDRKNREVLANELFLRCLRMTKGISEVSLDMREGVVDLKEIARFRDGATVEDLKRFIAQAIKDLQNILEAL